jgi:hypothetical protein
MGADRGIPSGTGLPGSPNVIIGDSIVALFFDPNTVANAEIDRVALYFAITEGPHEGKTPLNMTKVRPGLWRSAIENPGTAGPVQYHFDFDDDTYFRGGDVVKYFWWAKTSDGRFGSSPPGINLSPDDVGTFTIETAELLTGGLWEVNFLPKINWDPDFLTDIKLTSGPGDFDYYDPAHPEWRTPGQTTQANAILYVNKVNTGRRSGSANRTSFMFTLDALGYKGRYDVYDLQGFGNTNNDLASRASIPQVRGYSLIVHDAGRASIATIPDGTDRSFTKVQQSQWYASYLDDTGFDGSIPHSLWVIGENWASERRDVSNTLVTSKMGAFSAEANQTSTDTPEARGQIPFAFHDGWVEDFSADRFCLAGGCPSIREYDGMQVTGGGMLPTIPQATHLYHDATMPHHVAIVMNRYPDRWNTIGMSFNWFDIRSLNCPPPPGSEPVPEAKALAAKILRGVLPTAFERSPTDVEPPIVDDGLPRVTKLFPNVPNPFNPRTTIRFHLAQAGPVRLRVYDSGGRHVRTLVNAHLPRERHEVAWDGTSEAGPRVASGVYFCRLEVSGQNMTHKLVVLK